LADRLAQGAVDQHGKIAGADRPGPDRILGRIFAIEQAVLQLDQRAVEIVHAPDRQRRVGRLVIALPAEPFAGIAIEQVVAAGLGEGIGIVGKIVGLDKGGQPAAPGARAAQNPRIGQNQPDGRNRKARPIIADQPGGQPVQPDDLHLFRAHFKKARGQIHPAAGKGRQQCAQALQRFIDLVKAQHVFHRMAKIMLVHAVDGDDFHPMSSGDLVDPG